MASTKLDLPDPVGPVKANRSTSSNSTTVGSPNAVKPSTSSRLGRMRFLQQRAEQRGEPAIVDLPLGQVVGEQLVRRTPGPAHPRRVVVGRPGRLDQNL